VGTTSIAVLMQQAAALYGGGAWADAERSCSAILATRPDHFGALSLLGIIAAQSGRSLQAAELLGRAATANPGDARAHNNYGNVLRELTRSAEALESYESALKLKPDYAEAWNNRGNALRDVGRPVEALESYERALALKPSYAEAHNNRGVTLEGRERFAEAAESFASALRIRPDYAEAHYNRGNVLRALERPEEALESYERALMAKGDFAEAHYNRGNVLRDLERPAEALASYDRALSLKADFAEAHKNRGLTLYALGRIDEAVHSFTRVLALTPDFGGGVAGIWLRGLTLRALGRLEEAMQSFTRVLDLSPDFEWALGNWLHAMMQQCHWQGVAPRITELATRISESKPATTPFALLSLIDSPPLQRQAAEIWVAAMCPANPVLGPLGNRRPSEKIRLGYYSADFHEHATAYLIAELIERHDRSCFEVVAFSFGPESNDAMRKRLTTAFDQFIDVRTRSDRDIAGLSRELGIDIAVDLKGFSYNARSGIFAHRVAPLQVNYLGYPGTMGAPYIDYLIADHTLIPSESRAQYSENIVYLPHSYQANDRQRQVADKVFSRAELGLPAAGFLFCCFNNLYKITPEVFDHWMRLLRQLPESVLWLLEDNATATANLRREASVRGVSGERLVFAGRLPLAEHLARHRCADLFLDTWPCNAHTTASDALWAGLPVLTRLGEAFAARVAGSLLNALGLPELITRNAQEYQTLALELASQPTRLSVLKERLERNRLTRPLFDTPLYTRHLEAAYRQMYERHQANLGPDDLYVAER
jgi:predicted O-linked N-acetylglucosamine transferase (SPINDLY family)